MIDILRQVAVVLGALAILGIFWWAFSPKRKKRFEEDAKLPFEDEALSARAAKKASEKRQPRGKGTEPSEEQYKRQDKE